MNIQKLLPATALTFALGAMLCIAACSKATAENYAKVETGMSHDQVHAILGKPDETTGGKLAGLDLSNEKWKGSKQTITATYTGDHLAVKSIEPSSKDEAK